MKAAALILFVANLVLAAVNGYFAGEGYTLNLVLIPVNVLFAGMMYDAYVTCRQWGD